MVGADGTLEGTELEQGPVVAVAAEAGAVLVDARTLASLETVDVGGAAKGVGVVRDGLDAQVLYVSAPTSVEESVDSSTASLRFAMTSLVISRCMSPTLPSADSKLREKR